MTEALLLVAIGTALLFDFTNGFHDTANAIATSISTRALSPRLAVLMSAVLNLVGALVTVIFFGTRCCGPRGRSPPGSSPAGGGGVAVTPSSCPTAPTRLGDRRRVWHDEAVPTTTAARRKRRRWLTVG